MQSFVEALTHNYILVCAVAAWFMAQTIKSILTFVQTKEFRLERLVGSGGMPSSHSASVCSMVVGLIKLGQVNTPLFGIAFLFAMIVMHDAMGVRLESGKHARLINILIKRTEIDEINNQKDLKELLGHTAMQVLVGGLLGIVIALFIPVF